MRGIEIFQKPSYREISPMRDCPMRGPPVSSNFQQFLQNLKLEIDCRIYLRNSHILRVHLLLLEFCS